MLPPFQSENSAISRQSSEVVKKAKAANGRLLVKLFSNIGKQNVTSARRISFENRKTRPQGHSVCLQKQNSLKNHCKLRSTRGKQKPTWGTQN